MRERLLRSGRNDNVQYVIKDITSAIARVFSKAITRFQNGELGAASQRQDNYSAKLTENVFPEM
ncbi:MAG: hypothetical protein E3K40_02540 [Candidatus Brocadia sp.]|nr:hypothetical protein [Candidatus Brocadia sp.]